MQGILLTERIWRTASDANVSRNDITLPVICVVNSERTGKIQRVDDGRTQDDFSIGSTGEIPVVADNASGPSSGLLENQGRSGNEVRTSTKETECDQTVTANIPTQQGDAPQTVNGKHNEQASNLTKDQSANANTKTAVSQKSGRASKVKVSSASDLPPEPEEGNVEYKRTLASASKSRFEHLVTQLKWRLEEGNGTAVYQIGVEDDGRLTGLNDHDLEWSLDTLFRMARCLGASCRVLRQLEVPNGSCQPTATRMRFGRRRQRGQQDELAFPCVNGGNNGFHQQSYESLGGNPSTATNGTAATERRRVAQVQIRQIAPGLALGETRVALLGDADAGKSTLIAVLAHGELDNARGRARLHLFRHRHEIESGRSSSASLEIVGVSDAHETVSYATAYSVAALFEASRFVLAFVDLAGHPRFVRTTLSGLTAYAPQLTLLVISACGPLSQVTRDHFQVARALGLPVVIIVNKIDLCRNGRSHLFEQLATELLPCDVNGQADKRVDTPSLLVVDSPVKVPEALEIVTSRQSPIVTFAVSCVSGENLELLQTFLNGLPERFGSANNAQRDATLTEPSDGAAQYDSIEVPFGLGMGTALSRSGEFLVDGVLTISQLGKVLCGTVVRGTLNEGDAVSIGPDTNGHFYERTISSIQRFGLPCSLVTAGQTASLHLGRLDEFEPRKGHVVLRSVIDAGEHVALKFQARVRPFEHSSKLREKMEVTVHCRNVTQTCTVVHVDDAEDSNHIGTSSNSISFGLEQVVHFSFLKHPEYLNEDSPIVFRGSRARGVGRVMRLFPIENEAPSELGFKRISSTKTGTKSKSLSESCSCTENLDTTVSPAPSLARPGGTNNTISSYSTNRTTQSANKLSRTRCRMADSQTHERSLTESHCHA